ncbi:iron dicitrate transport regulator FecR [Ramlibacter sp. H39-3-26]|uniref:iron dicitrate transport regulator FecR n=1 Tax=Curvibacter soli TaxID=3031331 RepID=UPI0023DC0510|nr:iron dicitrate transport regulator FecR [Ramlibacter sp. H39-3-26]MDF1485020.1 iron dicitrate transport regulator FecR [Ramlibacter sp. H39-3-26]
MTQHLLASRAEDEVLWLRRRGFLRAAAGWAALGGAATVQAQQRGNIVELRGDALLNGARLLGDQVVQTGDMVETGPGAHLVFVIGNASFLVRQNSRLAVERGSSLNAVSLLRLVTGAVASVWGRGMRHTIAMPTLTAGIRGTGVYAEVFADQDNRSYFCNCYGTVDMVAGIERVESVAEYHQAFWGEPTPRGGMWLTPARAINHTDEEIEALAALLDQRTAWQILGRKGVKDGYGYMDEHPGRAHPAAMRHEPGR